jgi:hypothetical protein
MKYELLFAANSHQRKAGFLNETVAQLEISSEFDYMNRDQLDPIEKKLKALIECSGNSPSLLKERSTDDG